MRRTVGSFMWILLVGLGLCACSSTTLTVSHCTSRADCPEGTGCISGFCTPLNSPDGDADKDADANESDLPDSDLNEKDGFEGNDSDTEPNADGDPDVVVPDGDPTDETETTEADSELAPPANDRCAGAIFLPLDTPTAGTSVLAANDFDPGPPCTGQYERGADVVYRVPLEAGESVVASITPNSADYDPALYFLAACSNDDATPTCLAGGDANRAGARESLPFTASQSGIYFLVVDSLCDASTPNCTSEGAFTIAVNRRPKTADCAACGAAPDYDCGPNAQCVTMFGLNGETVETSCLRTCSEDADCAKGYACGDYLAVATETGVRVCAPRYGESDRNAVVSCAAMRDLGTPCTRGLFSDDESVCGADDGETIFDDAVCYNFVSLTAPVSYCTIYCIDDSQCPDGYTCYQVTLSQDRVCRRQ